MGSRLALTEKKPTKGRVFGSVIFHLLDWNKMLSKKKKQLFSNNKLLLPSVVKNFDGDEKLPTPKHSMNADENLEIHSISRNQNGLCDEIRDPGPIAKLMGLDSMPIVHHKKHSQPSLTSEFNGSGCKTSEMKESRPQKLQQSREPLSSSCEALQPNRQARRQHHQKISSSAKSPSLLSKKNTSLLMDAATKILEPKTSSKCALTYMDSSQSDTKVSKGVILTKKYRVSSNDSVVGQSRSSRGLNETMGLRLRDGETSVEENRMKPPPFIQAKVSSMDVQANISVERRVRGLYEKKNYIQDEQNRKFLRHKPMPPVKGKLVFDSKMCNKQSNRRGNVACECPRTLIKELVRETADNKANVVLERKRGSNVHSKNDKVARNCAINGKGKRVIGNHSINHSSSKSESKNHVEGIRGSEENIISLAFSSPIRQMADKRRFMDKLKPNCNASLTERLASENKIHSIASQREEVLQGDSLSALLEQKIEQLNSLDSDKLVKGDDLEGRSTASILGELISALRPGNEDSSGSDPTDISDRTISNDELAKADERFQGEPDDGDQPSPISILDVSFSNDSCCSASPHGSSGHQPDFGSIDTCNNIQSLDLDTDRLDSASSFNMEKITPDSLGDNSVIEDIINLHEVFPSEWKLVSNSNAKILIDATSSSNFNGNDPFILDALDAITEALGLMGGTKVVNQLRKLIFDCMMEFLDSQFYNFLKPEPNRPLLTRRESLTIVVCDQIEGWNGLAGKAMDDMLENDIRHSNEMWTKLKSEAYEIGVQIVNDITDELVGEMVIELCI